MPPPNNYSEDTFPIWYGAVWSRGKNKGFSPIFKGSDCSIPPLGAGLEQYGANMEHWAKTRKQSSRNPMEQYGAVWSRA